MAPKSVSQNVYTKALKLASEQPGHWARGTSMRTGRRFWIVPASEEENRRRARQGLPPGAHYTALDGSGCTCAAYNRPGRAGGKCSHTLAAEIIYQERPEEAGPEQTTPDSVDAYLAGIVLCTRCGERRRVGMSKLCADCFDALNEKYERLYPLGQV